MGSPHPQLPWPLSCCHAMCRLQTPVPMQLRIPSSIFPSTHAVCHKQICWFVWKAGGRVSFPRSSLSSVCLGISAHQQGWHCRPTPPFPLRCYAGQVFLATVLLHYSPLAISVQRRSLKCYSSGSRSTSGLPSSSFCTLDGAHSKHSHPAL